MAAKEPAISPAGLRCTPVTKAYPNRGRWSVSAVQQRAVVKMQALLRTRVALATVVAVALALMLSTAAYATSYTVNTLNDTNGAGDCSLRDAINAANGTPTSGSTCTTLGSGSNTIMFSSGLSGTITLNSELPGIFNTLTIQGPSTSTPAITISGAGQYEVMFVSSSATLNLVYLTIADASGISMDVVGGIYNDGTLTVSNSTLSGNNGAVGGIYNDGTLTVVNSTFSGNSGVAGGIFNDGTLTVVNSTVSGNSSSQGAGGIYNRSITNLKGTILAASGGPNCYGSITDEGYNISDDSSCGFSATGTAHNGDNVNPMLSTAGLANNGGPTQTIALLPGSPAIDTIPQAACTYQNVNPCTNPPTPSSSGPLVCDQRGEPQPPPGQSACDIGAFELQQTVPFAQFKAALGIDLPDRFALLGTFVPGRGGTINPATQAVALTLSSAKLAPVTLTIPAGSFKKVLGQYVFKGEVDGVKVAAVISAPFKNSYGFTIGADGLELRGVSNPVTVTLQVGANSGTITVKALIV